MERASASGVAIAASVVNSSNEADLPTSTKIIDKGRRGEDLKLGEVERRTFHAIQRHLTASDLVYRRLEVIENTWNSIDCHGQSESDTRIFVGVADHAKRKIELWDPLALGAEHLLMSPDGGEVLSAWHVLLNLKLVSGTLSTHSHAAAAHIVDVGELDHHFGGFVRLGDGLTTDDELRVGFASTELSLEGLSTGAHDLTHGGLNLTEQVIITITVVIDYTEFDILFLFEVVSKCESRPPVRVEVVLNLLSCANFDPRLVAHLENLTDRVRLAERVLVRKVARRNEQVYLHLQVICG